MGRRSDRDLWRQPGDIEFVTPDPGAFGSAASSATPAQPPAPDRVGPLPDSDGAGSRPAAIAAIGLVAVVVAAAIAVAAPWRNDPTDTTATTTTTPAAPTTVAPTLLLPDDAGTGDGEPVRGVVLDPPAGWRVAGALTEAPFGNFEGWGEVWAQPGSTRMKGAWYSLSITPFGLDGVAVTDAVRVDVDGRTALVERAADGALTLTMETPFERRDRVVRIEARGTTVDALTAFAGSIGIEDDRPQLVDDRFVYRDPSYLESMSKVWSGPTDWDPIRTAVIQDVLAYSLYTDDQGGWLWLGLHDTEGPISVLAQLEFEQQLVRAVGPDGVTDVLVGRSPQRSSTFFSFEDRYVSAVSTLGELDLMGLLPTVRRATSDEWAAAQRQSRSFTSAPPWGSMVAVDQTLPGDGTTWALSVEPQGRHGEIRVVDGTGRFSSVIELFSDADDPVGVVSTIGTTVVVARRPGSHTLQVTSADGSVIELAFTDVGAAQVDAFGSFDVVLLDATGQVVHTE
jgi:hypothetical protein